MRRLRVAAVAALLFIAAMTGGAPAWASPGRLPVSNSAHRCVHHSHGACGWTHHKKPKSKTETALCKDATLSYSRHSQGTCSHHHGVRYWFK